MKATENYRDGFSSKLFGWPGKTLPAVTNDYPSFRLYARSIHEVSVLRDRLESQGLEIYTRAEEIEVVQNLVKKPLDVTENVGKFDLLINVTGGGYAGQAGACVHGIARALVAYDEENRPTLKANGMLTRDPRMVERKKYGQRGARRKFQFSKR